MRLLERPPSVAPVEREEGRARCTRARLLCVGVVGSEGMDGLVRMGLWWGVVVCVCHPTRRKRKSALPQCIAQSQYRNVMVAAPSFLIHSRLSPWMMVRSWVRGLANRLEAEAQNDQMMKGRWLGWNGGGRPSWPRLNPHTVGIEWPWKTQRLWLAASHRWDPSEAACRAGATTDESSEPSLTRVGYDTSFFFN